MPPKTSQVAAKSRSSSRKQSPKPKAPSPGSPTPKSSSQGSSGPKPGANSKASSASGAARTGGRSGLQALGKQPGPRRKGGGVAGSVPSLPSLTQGTSPVRLCVALTIPSNSRIRSPRVHRVAPVRPVRRRTVLGAKKRERVAHLDPRRQKRSVFVRLLRWSGLN